ncbi:MAG: imelysin family protein [Polyangiaceae bacterium]
MLPTFHLRLRTWTTAFFAATAVASGILLAVACSESVAPQVDTGAVLGELTANVALPLAKAVGTEAEALRADVVAFESAPSDDALAKAQGSWRKARAAWRTNDAVAFGPVESKRLEPAMDFTPASADAIERAVTEGGADAAAFEALGSNAKGLHALEYLLFDDGGGRTEALAKMTDATTGTARRAYASRVATVLAAKAAELFVAWDASGENFAGSVASAGGSSAIYPSTKAAVDDFVNQMNVAADRLQNTEIGYPFGKKTGGTPSPEAEASRRSDASLADMTATLDGIRRVYLGDAGKRGLGAIVAGRSQAADAHMKTALDGAAKAIAAIPAPFRTAVTANVPEVEAAYAAAKDLKTTVSTEVASVLGTTLKFSDNDGD